MKYTCMNCPMTFSDFPSANNHEKAHKYSHLTKSDFYETLTEELVECADGCGQIRHASEMVWDEETDQPYVSLNHMAEAQQNRGVL